jgi:anti-anti-sigma factor
MTVVDLRASVATEPSLAAVITLDGGLDRTTAPMAEELMSSALDDGPPRLVLDMDRISDIDLHGLDVLIRTQDRARRGGTELVVRSPSRRVLDMLLLTGLDALISIELPARTPSDDAL